jgi:hypothetical protein
MRGSAAREEHRICVAMSTSGIRTWQDVFAKEFVVARQRGLADETPHMVNALHEDQVVSGQGRQHVFLRWSAAA